MYCAVRSVISGGTIGATADQFALESADSSTNSNSNSRHKSLALDSDTETRGAQVLKGYATGHMRLSTFDNVPDTVSSVMGSLSFGDSDGPDQIVFKSGVDEMRSPPRERAPHEREPRFVPLMAPSPLPVTSPLTASSSAATSVGLSTSLTQQQTQSQQLSRTSAGPSNNTTAPPRAIQGATFRKLVEKLTHPEYHSTTFATHFLLTYRVSQSPQELLALLLARYHHADTLSVRKGNRAAVLARNPVQDRVCLMLEMWLDLCFAEFVNDSDLTTRLLAFVFRDLEGNILMNDYAMRVRDTLFSWFCEVF